MPPPIHSQPTSGDGAWPPRRAALQAARATGEARGSRRRGRRSGGSRARTRDGDDRVAVVRPSRRGGGCTRLRAAEGVAELVDLVGAERDLDVSAWSGAGREPRRLKPLGAALDEHRDDEVAVEAAQVVLVMTELARRVVRSCG